MYKILLASCAILYFAKTGANTSTESGFTMEKQEESFVIRRNLEMFYLCQKIEDNIFCFVFNEMLAFPRPSI